MEWTPKPGEKCIHTIQGEDKTVTVLDGMLPVVDERGFLSVASLDELVPLAPAPPAKPQTCGCPEGHRVVLIDGCWEGEDWTEEQREAYRRAVELGTINPVGGQCLRCGWTLAEDGAEPPAPALKPLDVEAVAEWLTGIDWKNDHDFAEALCQHFGVPTAARRALEMACEQLCSNIDCMNCPLEHGCAGARLAEYFLARAGIESAVPPTSEADKEENPDE